MNPTKPILIGIIILLTACSAKQKGFDPGQIN